MSSSRKRKFGASLESDEDGLVVTNKLRKYKELIKNGDERRKRKAIRHLKRLLVDSRDNVSLKRIFFFCFCVLFCLGWCIYLFF